MSSRAKMRLVLKAETVRTLSAAELAQADGGFTNVSGSCLCNSFVCSIGGDCPSTVCPRKP